MKTSHTTAAALLGSISGMRSLSALAVFSHYLKYFSNKNIQDKRLGFVNSTGFALVSKLLAAGELAADKTPEIPDRITPTSVAGRAAAGALVGAAVFALDKHPLWKGALIGAGTAVASTYASFYARRYADQHTSLPDAAIGAIEDAVVLTGSAAVVKNTVKD